ncbi:MAG: class I SAM-dependent methyltransferase [Pseudomonadota bacterium]
MTTGKTRSTREPGRFGHIFGKRSNSGLNGMYRFSHGVDKAWRGAIINHLITLYSYENYLEIGLGKPKFLHDWVLANNKISVDPDPTVPATFSMTSDEFFEQNEQFFDLIFIDGLHTGDQVEKDITNALQILSPGGIILLHDLNPPDALHAREEFCVNGRFPPWNGTSWQGYARHRKNSPNLEMYVIDTDYGVGFVRPGRQTCYEGPVDTYEDLDLDRGNMLNLISMREFLMRHPAFKRPSRLIDPLLSRI